jgi:hypothetical protein
MPVALLSRLAAQGKVLSGSNGCRWQLAIFVTNRYKANMMLYNNLWCHNSNSVACHLLRLPMKASSIRFNPVLAWMPNTMRAELRAHC